MQAASRLRDASPTTVDAVVAATVAFPVVMDAWWNEPGTRQADAVTYALAAASVVALLMRRRWPVGVAVLAGVSYSALYQLGHHGELLNLPVMVALFTIAVRDDRRATVLTAVVASAWSGALGVSSDDPIGAPGGSPVVEMIWPLIPLALGEAVRSRRELARFTEAEAEREAQRRTEAERLRMARELHDVVAHTLAAVNVQMAAAVAAFDADPDKARAALHQARASSRMALHELRATVALTRQPDSSAPAPRLDQITELAEPARAGGIGVTFHHEHGDIGLSGAAELAAYRVVQEAITNVVRHSNASHIAVSLRDTPGGFLVEIADNGTTAPRQPAGGRGFGLTGMAERVHAVGGRLEHGPASPGGFCVRALFPATESG